VDESGIPEEAHNIGECICADCRTRRLQLKFLELQSKLADERDHFAAQMQLVEQRLLRLGERVPLTPLPKERFEREMRLSTQAQESQAKRITSLEETVRSHTMRLRALEANRPIQLGDREEAAVKSQLRKVELLLESVHRKLETPGHF
jgi:hypothetical protein